eukprot:3181968-Amphidinium_carterae.1
MSLNPTFNLSKFRVKFFKSKQPESRFQPKGLGNAFKASDFLRPFSTNESCSLRANNFSTSLKRDLERHEAVRPLSK